MDGAPVEIRYTKWGGHGHWRFTLTPLGSDRFGWWLAGRAGTPQQRGEEPPVRSPTGFVMLVPAAGSWTAFWNAYAPASPFEVYVDVTTRPVRAPGLVTAVDLDLDVVRRRDGRVEVLDEDEFAEHQVRYGYPREVVDGARSTARWLVDAVSARVAPFDDTGPAWLARVPSAG
jgi:uncharacterized protein